VKRAQGVGKGPVTAATFDYIIMPEQVVVAASSWC